MEVSEICVLNDPSLSLERVDVLLILRGELVLPLDIGNALVNINYELVVSFRVLGGYFTSGEAQVFRVNKLGSLKIQTQQWV